MKPNVTPIRPDVDDDVTDDFTDGPWLSTEASIDTATGNRADPFETTRPSP